MARGKLLSTTDIILILGALVLLAITISVIVGALLPPQQSRPQPRRSGAHRWHLRATTGK